MGKYVVHYFRCEECGLVQTEEPYWLESALKDPISKSDVGLVGRNLWMADIAKSVILAFFHPGSRFLDYGGGYGLFVRLMRDAGFDFYYYDEYCRNLLADGFEHHGGHDDGYELATAFEVFEHMSKPLEEIEKILGFSRNILLSTRLLPVTAPQPGRWWYYGLEHGQHVSLYTRRTMEVIARRFGLYFYTDGEVIHLFTETKLPSVLFRMCTRPLFSKLVALMRRRKSLLAADYKKVTGKDSEL